MRWSIDGSRKENQVPLKTESKVVARERTSVVSKYESDIKAGMDFDFAWMSDDTTTKIKRFTLQDATDLWINKRKGNMRASTFETNQTSLTY